jgi:hypothetical protein
LEDLSFELLDYGEVVSVLGKVSGVLAIGFGDLGGGGTDGMDRSRTGVNREKEGDTGTGEVIGVGHHDGEMAVGSATAGGMDGTSIGVELLLEELDGRVVWLTRNGGEKWMGERERRRRRLGREAHRDENVWRRREVKELTRDWSILRKKGRQRRRGAVLVATEAVKRTFYVVLLKEGECRCER